MHKRARKSADIWYTTFRRNSGTAIIIYCSKFSRRHVISKTDVCNRDRILISIRGTRKFPPRFSKIPRRGMFALLSRRLKCKSSNTVQISGIENFNIAVLAPRRSRKHVGTGGGKPRKMQPKGERGGGRAAGYQEKRDCGTYGN